MGYSGLSKYRSELMGMAMLWVMCFHAWNLDLGCQVLEWVRAAGFGGVDIFIVLSAMGLVMSLSRREQDFSSFMARRALRILPAYFIVMLAYTAFSVVRQTAPPSAFLWNSLLLNYWVHARGSFNWYVSGIMLFYTITPFCFRQLKKKTHRALWVGAGIVLGLLACRLLIVDNYWNYLDVFYRVPVFFLGLLLGFYVYEKKPCGGKDKLFWVVWTLLGAGYLVLSPIATEAGFYLPLCHLFLFTTVPMCFAACFLFEKLPLGWLRKFLRLVGENSLEIYLLNVSFFSELDLLQSYFGFGPTRRLYFLIAFTLNILLGVGLHRLVAAGESRLKKQRI